jgi:hypothetical protein
MGGQPGKETAMRAALAAGLMTLGTAAAAEGTSVLDLGQFTDRASCMQQANKVLRGYIARHGGYEVQSTEWVVYGWDLEPGNQDAVIMCPVVNGDVINAFTVIHGEDTDENREFTANEIDRMWFGE